LGAPRALQAAVKLIEAIRGDPAESFLLTLGYVNLAPLIRMSRARARIVLRIGNTATPELRTLGALARWRYLASLRLAASFADRIVVQSRYMGDDLVRRIGGIAGKTIVIHNFVEKELSDWRGEGPLPLDKPYLFCAATMKPQKGLDVLLAAFARSPRRSDTRLVVAGVDPDDPTFNRLLSGNGLSKNEVIRPGWVDRPYAWILHSELCVLASRFEGFSNFLLEAAALGKHIVATDCPGGNSELFAHYPNATQVPVDDVEALATALAAPRGDFTRDEAHKCLQAFDEDRIYGAYREVLAGESSGSRVK
jgi:glycosyltransferase involved in cell wall biosynthesis